MAIFEFNPMTDEEIKENTSSDPIPVGEYKVQLIEYERKAVNNQPEGNYYLNCYFEVIDGKYKSRRIWSILSLWKNTDDKKSDKRVMAWAQHTLKEICAATKTEFPPKDFDLLLRKPIKAVVVIEEGRGGYPAKNKITKYTAINGGNTLPQTQETKKEKYPAPDPDEIEDNSGMPDWA